MRPLETTLLCLLLGVACACAANDAGDVNTGTSETGRGDRFSPNQGITEEQLAELERAVLEHPDDPRAHQQLGRGLRDARRNKEAVEHLERAVQLDPSNPRLMLDLAIGYSSIAELKRAEAIYDDLELVPTMTALALHNKGNIALRLDELDRAIELYRRALEIDRDYLLAWYHLGVALEQKGDYREAYRAFGRVLELDPPEGDPAVLGGYVDALYRMGKLDVQMGATERGAQLLAELLETYPNHPNAHYQYGQTLMRLGRQEEAEKHFALHMKILARQKPTGPVATGD